MKLPDAAHTDRPWRIHDIAGDFRLEDVWALPTPGGPDDFGRLIGTFTRSDPSRDAPLPARALWRIRWALGDVLGWDDEKTGPGERVETLRDRLPADLQAGERGPAFDALPFQPVYRTDDEFVAEIANATMHGAMHLAWVPDSRAEGGFRGQMAVLVKPNGVLGDAYMAAIRPFRHLIVYPPMMRQLGRDWRTRTAAG